MPGQDAVLSPNVEVKIIDGETLVNMLKHTPRTTFEEYATSVFVKYVTNDISDVARLVWDRYLDSSFKGHTREKRVKSTRRQVSVSVKLPCIWQEILQNKTELFQYLTQKIAFVIKGKFIISTLGVKAISNKTEENLSLFSDCHHEESDTRKFIHVKDAAAKVYRCVMICIVDTDVVVLGMNAMQHIKIDEMWISFGVGKKSRYIPIHEICNILTLDHFFVV